MCRCVTLAWGQGGRTSYRLDRVNYESAELLLGRHFQILDVARGAAARGARVCTDAHANGWRLPGGRLGDHAAKRPECSAGTDRSACVRGLVQRPGRL